MPRATSMLVVGKGSEASRLRQRLARHFLTVERARTIDETRQLVTRCRFHLLLLVDPEEPWPVLHEALDSCDGLPSDTLLITEKTQAETAVDALRGGVSDVLLRPFSTEDLVATVNAIRARGAARRRRRIGGPRLSLVGNSEPIRELEALIDPLAAASAAVLIEGEAGTGRELVARLLHEQGERGGSFVSVDCRAGAHDRLEREIFGVDRTTDAADTLFLEEIHEMPLDLQVRMLRSMEGHATGADGSSRINSRIIASTGTNLAERAARGRFSKDLFHRVGMIRIGVPPLRDRREDIPLLAAHFIDSLSASMGLSPVELDAAELDALGNYHWPGNVSELRGVVEQLLLHGRLPADALDGPATRNRETLDYPLDWTLEQVKRHHMASVLEACDGNKSAAARRLGISRKTLDRKLGAASTSKGVS